MLDFSLFTTHRELPLSHGHPILTPTYLPPNLSPTITSQDLYFILGADDICNCNSAGYTNSDVCYPTDPTSGSYYTCTPNDVDSTGCCDTYVFNMPSVLFQYNCNAKRHCALVFLIL